MNDVKFFDQTFKMLLGLTVSVWAIYIMLLVFASDADTCMYGSSWLFTASAWLAGISSAPPLFYGLGRLVFWPNGPKKSTARLSGWILGAGAGIFITIAILFALAISQYGCQ